LCSMMASWLRLVTSSLDKAPMSLEFLAFCFWRLLFFWIRSCFSSARPTVTRRSSSFQGFRMNLYTAPSLIAPITAFTSAWPVSMIRIVSGYMSLARFISSPPLITGIL